MGGGGTERVVTAPAGQLQAYTARDGGAQPTETRRPWPRYGQWAGLWHFRKGGHRTRWGAVGLSVAESTCGKPGPNGMAGRRASLEQAQSSPNAGRTPGGAGARGQVAGRQQAESDG